MIHLIDKRNGASQTFSSHSTLRAYLRTNDIRSNAELSRYRVISGTELNLAAGKAKKATYTLKSRKFVSK